MAKESKTREALREAAMTMIFAGCDALSVLEGEESAEDTAHDMVNWHFGDDNAGDEDKESSLSN